jgi:hypothetical protein
MENKGIKCSDVLEALAKDKYFLWSTEDYVKLRPFYEQAATQLPIILAPLLNQPVTLKNFAYAKFLFLKYYVESSFPRAYLKLLPDKYQNRDSLEIVIQNIVQGMYVMEFIYLETEDYLKEVNLSEERVMTCRNVGLSEENKERYEQGNLSIDDILTSQPFIIMINNYEIFRMDGCSADKCETEKELSPQYH